MSIDGTFYVRSMRIEYTWNAHNMLTTEMPRLNIIISDSHLDWLKANTNNLRTKSAVIRDLIESEMRTLDFENESANLPAYRVGAGKELSKEESKKLLLEEINHPSSKKIFPPFGLLGESVGKELEGTPRKPPFVKVIPDNLKKHEKDILEFFAKKPGEHNKNAWNRLISGLTGILDLDGDSAVEKQLKQGIEEGWRSITLANYKKWGKIKPKFQQQEPETKHPAYKVFSAEDGFGEPTTNPVLKELF